MIIRDRAGWPVEHIKGKTFINFLRIIIHGNIKASWRSRDLEWGDGPRIFG